MLTCQRAGPQKLRCGCVVAEHRSDLGFQLRDREDDLPVLPSDCLQRRALHRFIGCDVSRSDDIRRILWLGFIANAFYQFLFVLGLARTGAGNGALIMALSPVFAFLIGVAMGRERFSRGVLIGIIMSLAGVAAIVAFGSEGISFAGSWRGDLLMMAASICWGWQSAESTRLLGKYGPIRLTVATMIAGTAMMVPMSLPWIIAQPWPSIAPIAWLGLGYSALLSIAYGYFVWAHALNTIGVARTSVFNNLTPIVALLAGWLLLGENPLASQIAGVVLVLVGVFIVRSRKPIAIPDD